MNKRNSFISHFDSRKVCFAVKLVAFAALFTCYVNHILPQYKYGYDAALIDKVNRLESIKEPKIVLLGNSNVSFGMNSELLEEAMGMPVVNMGLHGACGNAFHEDMAKLNIVPGDIYVLCHGNFNDDNSIPDPVNTWLVLENHYHLWRILRIEDLMPMAKAFPIYLKKSLNLYSAGIGNESTEGVYSRNAFNKFGDVGVKRVGSKYTFVDTVYPAGIGSITVNRINKLNEYIQERGGTLVVAGYPIGKGSLTVSEQQFVDFQKELENELECPVISNYLDYMYDYKYFYDTYQHLNSEGADLRTKQLIDDLKRWIDTDYTRM